MKKTKISILLWLLLCPFISLAAPIINPIYTSDRFQPSDQFHAWCDNKIDIVFSLENSKINWLNAILQYDSQDIEIVSIIWENEKENHLSYVVNSDKIVLSKLKTDDGWLDSVKFTLTIKSKQDASATQLSFEEWSYVLDSKWEMISIAEIQQLSFAQVPECEPDIVAPSITLIFPSNKKWDFVALDTYYQFDIKDTWKGINPDSISMKIDWVMYDISQLEHERDWSILTVYPDSWAPFDSKFKVEISVSDKQVYWWANTTTEVFGFSTSDQVNLLNEIDPVEFRKLANSQKYYQWSQDECNLLAHQYAISKTEWNTQNQKTIASINKKLNCQLLSDSTISDLEIDNSNSFTIFSLIWWSLFGLLLLVLIFRYCSK